MQLLKKYRIGVIVVSLGDFVGISYNKNIKIKALIMQELLEIYDLEGNLIEIKKRDDFYSEIRKEFYEKGKISKKIKTVRILLMNSDGRIYLQKRSKLKNENPGLYDKTIGGHVEKGHSYDMTAIKECAEELGFPMTILSSEEFDKAIQVTDLSIVGIFKKVDYISNFISKRVVKDGSAFILPFMTNIYVGYYNGAIRFIDGESAGIEVFSLDELKNNIASDPNKFTDDLKFMIKEYESYLIPIKKQVAE